MTSIISFHLCVCVGGQYKGHVDILAPTVQELATLEREAQTSFLHLGYLPNQLFDQVFSGLFGCVCVCVVVCVCMCVCVCVSFDWRQGCFISSHWGSCSTGLFLETSL